VPRRSTKNFPCQLWRRKAIVFIFCLSSNISGLSLSAWDVSKCSQCERNAFGARCLTPILCNVRQLRIVRHGTRLGTCLGIRIGSLFGSLRPCSTRPASFREPNAAAPSSTPFRHLSSQPACDGPTASDGVRRSIVS
jgi:hypothetical protein